MNANDGPTDIGHLLRTQREAQRAAPFPDWPQRRDRLLRLRSVVQENEDAIERAIDADFGGRPSIETQIADIFPSLAENLPDKFWMHVLVNLFVFVLGYALSFVFRSRRKDGSAGLTIWDLPSRRSKSG